MRLTCPNCGAEYEVPDEVIPTSGRDVQCSNCGDTWFQYHPEHMPEVAAEPDVHAAPAPPPPPEPEPETEDSGDDAFEDEDDEDDYYEDEDAESPLERTPLRRRPLPSEVKTILREEAELEGRARTGDPLESQPDLGLEDPGPARREEMAEDRLSRLRRESADVTPPESAAPADPAASAEPSRKRGAEQQRRAAPKRATPPVQQHKQQQRHQPKPGPKQGKRHR